MPTKGSIHIGEEVFLTLSRGFHLARKAAENIIEPMGITLAEYNLLRVAENTKGVTAKEAQKRLFSTAPTVAHLVANMERKKFISRVQDKDDGRVQHIILTPKGRKLANNVKRKIRQLTASLKLEKSVLRSTVRNVSHISTVLSSSLS